MSTSIVQSIDSLCKEQGVDRDLVINAVKEAVRAAARKQFKSHENIQVDWSASGLEVFSSKVVVETVSNEAAELSTEEAREMTGDDVEVGDELQIPLPVEEMGRIAAQTARQILFQKVRDAVRNNIYEQYVDKIGDLVNGFVKRFERGDIIVDLGNNLEAILTRHEQTRGEQWNQNDRIRVVINKVCRDIKECKEMRGHLVEVSRTSTELIRRLFEMEVPEIYDGTVVIKAAIREPGDRAKIAVNSNERDVDPVGACVGMKGSRVQTIIRELRGEKIDIIEWSEEPSVFAANALSPAKVNQVRITSIDKRQMEVIVNEDQLSLAIGKRGQNVRLATKLVGWSIDIRSEDEVKREVAKQMGAMISSGESVPLSVIEGLTPTMIAVLAEHGVIDIQGLAAASIDQLTEYLDISLDDAQTVLNSVQAVVAASQPSAPPPDTSIDKSEEEQDAAPNATTDDQVESRDQPDQITTEIVGSDEIEEVAPNVPDVNPAPKTDVNVSPADTTSDATSDDEAEIQEKDVKLDL